MREFSAKAVRYPEAEVRIDARLLVTATVFVGINVWAVGRDRCAKDLNDSPWSKTVEIERKLGLEAPAGAPKLVGAPGVTEENEREEEDDDDRGGEGEEKGRAKFRVRWMSYRTLREAWVRGQVL